MTEHLRLIAKSRWIGMRNTWRNKAKREVVRG